MPMIKWSLAVSCALALSASRAKAQAASDPNLEGEPPIPIIDAQLPRSLISPDHIFGISVASTNLPDLLFEADIVPHFSAVGRAFPLGLGRLVKGVVVTPRVNLRMLDVDSKPVRSPSYVPQVAFYLDLPFRDDPTDFLVWTIAHYSNGQEGSPFEGGSANYVNGSFSDFFTEGGPSISVVSNRSDWFLLPSIQFHFAQDEYVRQYYGQWRIRGRTRINLDTSFDPLRPLGIDLRSGNTMNLWQFEGEVGWFPDRDTSVSRNWDVTANVSWFPGTTDNVGLFVGAYFGSDYYNARYTAPPLRIIRWGLTTR
jgi:hypothetical protein